MRRTAAFFTLVFAIIPFVARADGQSEQITIWHQFYFEKGLDYNRFAELGTSRNEFRRKFVEEMLALQEFGAKPIDAAVVLLALDGHYLETLDKASRGIEASFAAEFRSALVAQYERLNKPQRLVIADGAFYVTQPANWQPQQAPPDVDLVASGTWSNIDGNTVRVTVDFTTIGTGQLTSFTSQGTVPDVAGDIAFQLFDYFEKARFRQPDNAVSNLEIRPALPGHLGRMGVTHDVAMRAAESQGCRLPYSCEMDLIYGMGAYQPGGIDIDSNWYYHVADDAEHVWLAPGKLENIHGLSLANFEKRAPNYIMVKGTPSARVQTIVKLNSYLKSEYVRADYQRDELGIYAARLIVHSLNGKRGENDVAVRNMKQEFAMRRITPTAYLTSRGFNFTTHPTVP